MSNINEIVQYYYSCYSIKHTAQHFKETVQYITKILNKIGVQILSQSEAINQISQLKNKETPNKKFCRKCKTIKSCNEFAKNNICRNNYSKECKQCRYFRVLLNKYGLTKEQYNKLADLQNYKCGICKISFNQIDTLCVDHIKGTKIVRGLLCDMCNKGIGFLSHNIEYLQNAITFLQNPPGNILY